MQLLPAEETAKRLGVSLRSLMDKRYRFRIGLPAVKIGRRVVFEESAVAKLISRGREKLPARDMK